MALPTSKQPLPGFRLIADDAGSYIDDVNNIRLGPEFVLTRNTADPSAAVSVSAYIAAQIASAVAGAPVRIATDVGFSAVASVTIPLVANQYRKVEVMMNYSTGGPSSVVLTGLSNGTYTYVDLFCITPSTSGAQGEQGINNWGNGNMAGVSSAKGACVFNFSLPAAPQLKGMVYDHCGQFGDGTSIGRQVRGFSTDATHDPTEIVISFIGGSGTGTYSAWGYL